MPAKGMLKNSLLQSTKLHEKGPTDIITHEIYVIFTDFTIQLIHRFSHVHVTTNSHAFAG